MNDILIKIKRAVLSGRYAFSEKARLEMEMDNLTELDVAIYKKIRSRSPFRQGAHEYLYIIQSSNLEGLVVYTKGKLVKDGTTETYYFLISSRKAL